MSQTHRKKKKKKHFGWSCRKRVTLLVKFLIFQYLVTKIYLYFYTKKNFEVDIFDGGLENNC